MCLWDDLYSFFNKMTPRVIPWTPCLKTGVDIHGNSLFIQVRVRVAPSKGSS
jgi:hypothetical protein